MQQALSLVSLIVDDYDDAIAFYTQRLNFELLDDSYQPEQDKRWVVVAPPGGKGCAILLAKADGEHQQATVGQQGAGRVWLFLRTDDFWRDYQQMQDQGIEFVRPPQEMPYGTVAVFADLYGNQWDLIQYAPGHPMLAR